jgi:hypothetical protein
MPAPENLRVEFETQDCTIPKDERARMEESLAPVAEAVRGLPAADLRFKVMYHPNRQAYHVEARLQLSAASVSTGEWDPYLDSAFQRCVQRLIRKVQAFREHPDGEAEARAERLAALDQDVVAPEDPAAGPLGEAVRAGDYRTFRTALAVYEEWLRKRVGRWVQRFPEAEARVGHDLRLGDLVEEVFLNAFEGYTERTTAVRLSDWLDSLIDPSLKEFLRHPDEERANASLARTIVG